MKETDKYEVKGLTVFNLLDMLTVIDKEAAADGNISDNDYDRISAHVKAASKVLMKYMPKTA